MTDTQLHSQDTDNQRVAVWRSRLDDDTLLLRLSDGKLYEIPAGTTGLVIAIEYNRAEDWRELT